MSVRFSAKPQHWACAKLSTASITAFSNGTISSPAAGRSPLPATGAWAELAKQVEQRKQELAHKAGTSQPSTSQGAAPQQKSGNPQQKGDASQPSQRGTPQQNGSKTDSAPHHRSGTRGGALGPFLKRLRDGQFD